MSFTVLSYETVVVSVVVSVYNVIILCKACMVIYIYFNVAYSARQELQFDFDAVVKL